MAESPRSVRKAQKGHLKQAARAAKKERREARSGRARAAARSAGTAARTAATDAGTAAKKAASRSGTAAKNAATRSGTAAKKVATRSGTAARNAATRSGTAARNAAAGAAKFARTARGRPAEKVPFQAHLSLVRAPALPITPAVMDREIRVATYNVHRWTGLNGRRAPDPARACFVISELDADVIALQEVLRPSGDNGDSSDDPLVDLCDALGYHLVFAVTREHRRGQLGNAILSRFPVAGTSVLDISHSRIESRGALAAQFSDAEGSLAIVATHLSLVDRTRNRQVVSLLEHPQLNAGPAVLLGDMNAWRKCKATRSLDEALHEHNNLAWPASFPSAKPVLALDRIYTRGAKLLAVDAHDTAAARRASDHLPVIATVELSP